MIRLEKFGKSHYADLISWIDSEEMLMQFGGPLFSFPLTSEQLDASLSDENRISFCVMNNETNLSIGHCEIYLLPDSAKIGRILIGDPQHRGKGLGKELVGLLLDYVFTRLKRMSVELNVFDWNTTAIKCYEKAGFVTNPAKKLERTIKDKIWTAINMTITKEQWQSRQQYPA